MNPKYSLIIPFYNEKENLAELHERILRVLPQLGPAEILYVDDGSTDGGAGVLAGKDCKVLALETRSGKSAALFAAFQEARGEFFILLDADLQNPPEEIPKLAGYLKEAELAAGVRKKRHDSWAKKTMSTCGNGLRKRMLQDDIEDAACGMLAFHRELRRYFFPLEGMNRFFKTVVKKNGHQVVQVEIEHCPRKRGKSKYGFANRFFKTGMDLMAAAWLLSQRVKYRVRR